ncbi:hypothetical protein Tco_0893031 [Tanacetum coccineum]|uniref:Uncharacterized protein n=1 Tax=Tanacetum coccineum TaxID=301880 RepID=A0ABQ5CDU6_9ASTR
MIRWTRAYPLETSSWEIQPCSSNKPTLATDPEMCMFATLGELKVLSGRGIDFEESFVQLPLGSRRGFRLLMRKGCNVFVDPDHQKKLRPLRKALSGLMQALRAGSQRCYQESYSNVHCDICQKHSSDSNVFTMKMEISLGLASNKLLVGQTVVTATSIPFKCSIYKDILSESFKNEKTKTSLTLIEAFMIMQKV